MTSGDVPRAMLRGAIALHKTTALRVAVAFFAAAAAFVRLAELPGFAGECGAPVEGLRALRFAHINGPRIIVGLLRAVTEHRALKALPVMEVFM